VSSQRLQWSLPAALLALASAAPALAGDSNPLEELFLGQVVFTQARLELQTTMRGAWTTSRAGDTLTTGPLFELGLTDRLQLELEVEVPVRSDAPSQVRTGLKYGFGDAGSQGLGFAAGVEVGMPIGALPAGEGLETELHMVSYRKLGGLHLHFTTALELERPTGGSGGWQVGYQATLSAFVQLGRFLPVVELGWSPGDEGQALLAPALIWRTPPGLELGISAPVGTRQGAAFAGAILLLTAELDLTDR
jgi:hypothetical protein